MMQAVYAIQAGTTGLPKKGYSHRSTFYDNDYVSKRGNFVRDTVFCGVPQFHVMAGVFHTCVYYLDLTWYSLF
jgi:hypothetical protein